MHGSGPWIHQNLLKQVAEGKNRILCLHPDHTRQFSIAFSCKCCCQGWLLVCLYHIRTRNAHVQSPASEAIWETCQAGEWGEAVGFFSTTEGKVPPPLLCLWDVKRYLYMQIFLGHLLPSSWYLRTTGLIMVWDTPVIFAGYCAVFSLSLFILPEQPNLVSPCFFFQPGLFLTRRVLLLRGAGRQSSGRI